MTRLVALWDSLRASFWFVPTLGLVLGLVLSSGLTAIDRAYLEGRAPIDWLATTPAAARSILQTLTGALVTVTGLVFSITMLTLAQTGSQYGGRLLRAFLDRPLPQITLAAFLGTAVYSLRVLRTVREVEASPFAPHLATALAIGLFLACVALLLAFINYTARMLMPPNIVRSVSEDLTEAIERLYPAGVADPPGLMPPDTSFPGAARREVRLDDIGYLQAIDEVAVVELAERLGAIVRLRVRPGVFVGHGLVVAEILPESAASDETVEELAESFILGNRRTPRQDVEAAILELVEVAVRALSPGINDPRTAITCIHYLADGFVRLVPRRFPAEERFVDGELRLVMPREQFGAMAGAAFAAILHYAADFPPIIEAVLEGCGRITEAIVDVAAGELEREGERRQPRDASASEAEADAAAADREAGRRDLELKREAVRTILQLAGHRIRHQLDSPSRSLLLEEVERIEKAVGESQPVDLTGNRAADSMATSMEAVEA